MVLISLMVSGRHRTRARGVRITRFHRHRYHSFLSRRYWPSGYPARSCDRCRRRSPRCLTRMLLRTNLPRSSHRRRNCFAALTAAAAARMTFSSYWVPLVLTRVSCAAVSRVPLTRAFSFTATIPIVLSLRTPSFSWRRLPSSFVQQLRSQLLSKWRSMIVWQLRSCDSSQGRMLKQLRCHRDRPDRRSQSQNLISYYSLSPFSCRSSARCLPKVGVSALPLEMPFSLSNSYRCLPYCLHAMIESAEEQTLVSIARLAFQAEMARIIDPILISLPKGNESLLLHLSREEQRSTTEQDQPFWLTALAISYCGFCRRHRRIRNHRSSSSI